MWEKDTNLPHRGKTTNLHRYTALGEGGITPHPLGLAPAQ